MPALSENDVEELVDILAEIQQQVELAEMAYGGMVDDRLWAELKLLLAREW